MGLELRGGLGLRHTCGCHPGRVPVGATFTEMMAQLDLGTGSLATTVL